MSAIFVIYGDREAPMVVRPQLPKKIASGHFKNDRSGGSNETPDTRFD